VAVPGLKPVMQLRVGWSLATAAGAAFADNGYTTPYGLEKFEPKAEGFGDLAIDLTPRAAAVALVAAPASAEEGKRLAQLFACVACHAAEESAIPKSGPTWRGLFGQEKRSVFVAGVEQKVAVNEAYLRESILQPTAQVAAGFEKGEYAMPSYAGVLDAGQIESLVLYIKTLK
jgi:cytochrome c2